MINTPYIHQETTHMTSFDIFHQLHQGTDYFLLDSSKEESPYSQYSILGLNPFLTVKYKNKKIYVKDYLHNIPTFHQVETSLSIFDFLQDILDKHTIHNPTKLPFIAGGIGYFSYDLSKELENLPTTTHVSADIPDCYYVFYDNCIIHDLKTHLVTISGLGLLSDPEKSVKKILQELNEVRDVKRPKNVNCEQDKKAYVFKSSFTRKTYMNAIESMKRYIQEGHIYISNMTHTFVSPYYEDPLKTYEKLRQINPAPFSAYLPCDNFYILSSSPERFLELKNRRIQTRPIKGTLPRGKTPEEDIANRLQLEASEKDKSELLMIVDLERNDLSRVCIPGTVKVTELFKTEQYATVYHLVSTIVGQLKENFSLMDCIKATFPGGSITGAPKIRAMEIIDELEHTNRGLYTGSIGYLGFDGNADFNIVIRTVIIKDSMAYIGVGGGITWESDPALEYQETIDKGIALFNALDASYQDMIE